MIQAVWHLQILIECGTANLQPNEALMQNTVQRCRSAVYWMLNRTLPIPEQFLPVPCSPETSAMPLEARPEAEIIVEGFHAPWFVPRTSNPVTGRFYKPLSTGTYNLRFRKKGYWDTVIPNQMVYNNNWTQIQVQMQPREPASLSGRVLSGGADIAAQIVSGDVFPDTLAVNGHFVYNGLRANIPCGFTPRATIPGWAQWNFLRREQPSAGTQPRRSAIC